MKNYFFTVFLGKRSKYGTIYDKLQAEIARRGLILTTQEMQRIEDTVKKTRARMYTDDTIQVLEINRHGRSGLLISMTE